MQIELSHDYDRDDAIADADAWREVHQAIDTVLAANTSLESTGTLDYMPGMFDHTNIKLTPNRLRQEYDQKIAQIDKAVAKLRDILLEPRGEGPTPEEIALAEKPGPYDLGVGIYHDD